MILKINNGLVGYECRSDAPNSDFVGDAAYVINELDKSKADIIAKVKQYAPFITLTVRDGEVVDVAENAEAREKHESEHPPRTSKPEADTAEPSLADRVTELEAALDMILAGVVE